MVNLLIENERRERQFAPFGKSPMRSGISFDPTQGPLMESSALDCARSLRFASGRSRLQGRLKRGSRVLLCPVDGDPIIYYCLIAFDVLTTSKIFLSQLSLYLTPPSIIIPTKKRAKTKDG